MYLCLMVALNWAKGKGLSKKSHFPVQTWLMTHHWLPDSQLCTRALRLG